MANTNNITFKKLIFYLFFGNFIHVCNVSPSNPPHFYFLPSTFCPEPLPKNPLSASITSFIFITYWVQFLLTTCAWVCIYRQKYGNRSAAWPWMKMIPPRTARNCHGGHFIRSFSYSFLFLLKGFVISPITYWWV